jgi:hypothetical protein
MTTTKKTKVTDLSKRNQLKNNFHIYHLVEILCLPIISSVDSLVCSMQRTTFIRGRTSTIWLIQLTLQPLLETELSDLNNCYLPRRLTFLFARFQLSTRCVRVSTRGSESQIPHNMQFGRAFTPRSTHRLTLFQWREPLENNGRTMCQNTASPRGILAPKSLLPSV